MAKVSIKKVMKAIPGTHGIISNLARKVGITRKWMCVFLDRHPELKDLMQQESEKILDTAEDVIIKQINRKDIKTTKWFLNTKGKNRGYTHKQEIEHSGEVFDSVEINFNMPKIKARKKTKKKKVKKK